MFDLSGYTCGASSCCSCGSGDDLCGMDSETDDSCGSDFCDVDLCGILCI